MLMYQTYKLLCPLAFILRILEIMCFQSRCVHMHVNHEVALAIQLDAAALVIHQWLPWMTAIYRESRMPK